MQKMLIKNGAFFLDGKGKFLLSAEVHYFRIPKERWETTLAKVKEAGFETIGFYVPWIWHEIDDGVFDFEGHTHPLRDLKGFIDLVEGMGFGFILKPGPYVMSELKNEGLPEWLYSRAEKAIARTLSGDVHPTRVFTYNHPEFLRYVRRWYENVFDLVKGSKSLMMVQVDNEVGMLHWVTGKGDYNPFVIEKFRDYLRSIGNYELAEEIESWNYGERFSWPLLVEYHKFLREQFAQYLATLRDYVRESGVDVPMIVNVHGFDTAEYAKRGKKFPVGVSQLRLAANLEDVVLSGDYYIGNVVHENFSDLAIANAIMLAVQRVDQPLFSIEFQSGFQLDRPKLSPSTFELTTLQCVGNGMNGFNYYLFVGGKNPGGLGLMGSYHDWQAPISSDGTLRRSYYTIRALTEKLKSVENELSITKPVFDTYFGYIPYYFSTEFLREHGYDDSEVQFKREVSIFDGVLRGLKLLNYNFSAVDLEGTREVDGSSIPSLWVYSWKYMPRGVQQRLINYVLSGGRLIIFPEVPEFDEFGQECTLLRDFIGIKRVRKRGWGFAKAFDIEVNSFHVETYEFYPEVLGSLNAFGYFVDGGICGFQRGNVLVLGFGLELEREYKLAVLEKVCHLTGIKKSVEVSSDDGFLDAYLKTGADKHFIVLNNYDEYEKHAVVKVYLAEGNSESFEITVPGRKGVLLKRVAKNNWAEV